MVTAAAKSKNIVTQRHPRVDQARLLVNSSALVSSVPPPMQNTTSTPFPVPREIYDFRFLPKASVSQFRLGGLFIRSVICSTRYSLMRMFSQFHLRISSSLHPTQRWFFYRFAFLRNSITTRRAAPACPSLSLMRNNYEIYCAPHRGAHKPDALAFPSSA